MCVCVWLGLVLDCVEGVAGSWIGGNSGARCIQFTANKKKKSRISIRRYRYSRDTKNKMRLHGMLTHTWWHGKICMK